MCVIVVYLKRASSLVLRLAEVKLIAYRQNKLALITGIAAEAEKNSRRWCMPAKSALAFTHDYTQASVWTLLRLRRRRPRRSLRKWCLPARSKKCTCFSHMFTHRHQSGSC